MDSSTKTSPSLELEVEALLLGEMRKGDPSLPDDRLREILSEWEILPYLDGDQVTGAALMKGTEFHCHMTKSFRLDRGRMREFLRPLFEREGYLTTRVDRGDVGNQRLNRSFGFKKTWSDDRFHYYILTQLPFERNVCQQ